MHLYFRNAIALIGLVIASQTYALQAQEVSLQLNAISFDNKNADEVRQILFTFNQNVAILGAAPTQAQINSVTLSHGLSASCKWRFVKLNILACELSAKLPSFVEVSISIGDSFFGLGKQIDVVNSKVTSSQVITSLPMVKLHQRGNTKNFPNSFYSHFYADKNQHHSSRDIALLKEMLAALRLKMPNGELKKLDYLFEQERKNYASSEITMPLNTEPFESGLYQIVIPQGFTPTNDEKRNAKDQYRILANDEMLYEFRYSQSFEYYGTACESQTGLFALVTPSKNNLLKCPPEALSFVFSRKLKTPKTKDAWRPDWLQGPEYKVAKFTELENSYYYGFELQGNSEYNVSLKDVKSEQGLALKQQHAISFITPEATSAWYLRPGKLDVVEADRHTPIYIARRNVDDMQQSLRTIQSAEDLQAYLNRKYPATTIQSGFASNQNTKNQAGKQAIEFRKALVNTSGLVEVNLAGSHNNYANDYADDGTPIFNAPLETKEARFLANSAAFNLAVWHHSNLLVQAIDWEANALANAKISLVCESGSAPTGLGYTSDEGLLFVPTSKWARLYENDSENVCMLWASSKKGSSAIQLMKPEAIISTKPKLMAFTAQPIYEPGDTVHLGIIAKQREGSANADGTNRMLPMANLDNYIVQIMLPNSEVVHTTLNMSELTLNGLISASFIISNDDIVGRYPIVTKHKINNQTDFLGSVLVQEFTPPEFDLALELVQKNSSSSVVQSRVNAGESLQATLRARRLNGGALVNAKVSTRYQIFHRYDNPQAWPQDYVYTSYDEFKHHDTKVNISNNFTLEETGVLNFKSAPIQSTLPIAEIEFESEVTSDDGETQSSQDSILYLSRSHYIGSKISEDEKHLSLIAVNKDGNLLNDINLKVEFSKRGKLNNGKWTTVDICELKSLPNKCKVPILDTQLRANIVSGTQLYESIRNVYVRSEQAPTKEIDYPSITLKVRELQTQSNSEGQRRSDMPIMWDYEAIATQVGEVLNVSLTSNVTGTATFIVVAGNIQKVWQQAVVAGDNTIELPIEQSWIPAATVMVSLPVDRKVTDAIAKTLSQNNTSFSETPSPVRKLIINRHSNDLGQFRLLSASISLMVAPNELVPEVTITAASKQVLAGGELSISLHANTEVETQLWLVNDGILAMAGFNIEDIDPASFYLYKAQYDNHLSVHSLAPRLLTEDGQAEPFAQHEVRYNRVLNAFSDNNDYISVTGSRMRSEPANQSQSMGFTKKDFAQSVWLNTVNLKPNTPRTINIKLPQLIGRWKIIAMSLTKHQSVMSSADVATIKDLEYFLDSPNAIFDNDKSHVAITQINNTNHVVEDELTLWIDGKAIMREKVRLGKANTKESYSRVQLDLPNLQAGKHTIHITSREDDNFAAYAELMVLPSNVARQTVWLVGHNNRSLVAPPNVIANSLSLSALPSGGDAPNWQQVTQYNQEYPHMCWEQTISRAVSYAYSHKAKVHWPEGTSELNKLLKKQGEYTNGFGQYSFFPSTRDDAFLTAYTFLVYGWLKDSSTPLSLDVAIAADTLREYLAVDKNNQTSELEQSMALLALANNKSITVDEALEMRQTIGTSNQSDNANSLVLQALALKTLGANATLYEDILTAASSNKYKDTNTSLFNQNSYKCFAALTYNNASEERASLINEIVNQQQQKGHFGNTFANAVCSYLLQKNTDEVRASALAFAFDKDKLTYQYTANSNYWLRVNYLQNIAVFAEASAGVAVARTITVKRDDKWINIDEASIVVGDLIKTEIIVDSPIARQHVAITDSIAGGFEAIDPSLQKQRRSEYFDNTWFRYNTVQIRNGKAFWYINNLQKGRSLFVYFSRVRHSGEFIIAPVHIEAMYKTDVHANTQSRRISVK